MTSEDTKAARAEINEILKSICESDAHMIGVLLVDSQSDLITMQYIRKDQVRELSARGGFTELKGGVLGRLIPALKDLCLDGGLNIGDPNVSIILANNGTAIVCLITPRWTIIAFGKRELNIAHVARQIVGLRSKFQTLIEKAKLEGETFEEWGF
ncbi:MAG: hypothetical protein NDP22_00015 [Crenarchaeota archaeon]|nr:hypothetical protein [Thermoproteota archaeon]